MHAIMKNCDLAFFDFVRHVLVTNTNGQSFFLPVAAKHFKFHNKTAAGLLKRLQSRFIAHGKANTPRTAYDAESYGVYMMGLPYTIDNTEYEWAPISSSSSSLTEPTLKHSMGPYVEAILAFSCAIGIRIDARAHGITLDNTEDMIHQTIARLTHAHSVLHIQCGLRKLPVWIPNLIRLCDGNTWGLFSELLQFFMHYNTRAQMMTEYNSISKQQHHKATLMMSWLSHGRMLIRSATKRCMTIQYVTDNSAHICNMQRLLVAYASIMNTLWSLLIIETRHNQLLERGEPVHAHMELLRDSKKIYNRKLIFIQAMREAMIELPRAQPIIQCSLAGDARLCEIKLASETRLQDMGIQSEDVYALQQAGQMCNVTMPSTSCYLKGEKH